MYPQSVSLCDPALIELQQQRFIKSQTPSCLYFNPPVPEELEFHFAGIASAGFFFFFLCGVRNENLSKTGAVVLVYFQQC